MSGTSMSAAHVTGAYGVVAGALPEASRESILHWLQSSGVPVTYNVSPDPVTVTPRIEVLAAVELGLASPQLTIDDPTVAVDEGELAAAAGDVSDSQPESLPLELSASSGDPVIDGARWSWSSQTNDGPGQSGTVTFTATDSQGHDSLVELALDVANVAPDAGFDPSQDLLVAKREPLQLEGRFSDPGFGDFYSAAVDWGDGEETDPAPVTMTAQGPPLDLGKVSPAHALRPRRQLRGDA